MEDEKILGVIYALPEKIITNILSKNKNIFIKYFPKPLSKKSKIRLNKGMAIYFYASKEDKILLGEAIIDKILYETKMNVYSKFNNNLMLSKNELDAYCLDRETKPMLILILSKIKKYASPIKIDICINMGGLYITKENIHILRGK